MGSRFPLQPGTGLRHCGYLDISLHVYRSERECRSDNSCDAPVCPLASSFLFDETHTFAEAQDLTARIIRSVLETSPNKQNSIEPGLLKRPDAV